MPIDPISAPAAQLAAALSHPDRSIIGNPRSGTYAVSLITDNPEQATSLALQLATIEAEVRTNIRHGTDGTPVCYFVTIYQNEEHKRLLELVKDQLPPDRLQRLQDLVLARGPIPDDILEGINTYSRRGESDQQIANRLNDSGRIDGMGGHRWTARKIRRARQQYEARHLPEAAER